MPLDRGDPLHKRKPFDDRMARIGQITIQYNYLSKQHEIDKIILGDLLDIDDSSNRHIGEEGHMSEFTYDLRTGRIVDSLFDYVNQIVSSQDFISLIAQIKFLDGMTDGYSPEEIEALSSWLQQEDPQRMKDFFCNTILKHRPEQRFPHSQLARIFEPLFMNAE